MTNNINPVSPYWTPPPIFSTGIKGQKQLENNWGFFFPIPHPDIVTAGTYFGENPVPQRQELVYRSDPEFFTVGGKIPASGGVPKYNVYRPEFAFKRSDHTKKFSSIQ